MSNTLSKEEALEKAHPDKSYMTPPRANYQTIYKAMDLYIAPLKESLKPIIANMRTAAGAWGVGAFNSFADEIENLINNG